MAIEVPVDRALAAKVAIAAARGGETPEQYVSRTVEEGAEEIGSFFEGRGDMHQGARPPFLPKG